MNRHALNTIVFSSLTMMSRGMGLVRQMAVALVLSVTRFNDAYQLAYMLPFMLYEFAVGGILSAVLIPVLVREQQKHGKDSAEAWRVANLLLGTVGVALGIVSLLVIVFAPQVTYALTFLVNDPQAGAARELVEFFVRYFAPQMLFIGVNAVLQAILNSHGAFAVTGAAPILNNIIVIAAVLLFGAGVIGPAGLAIGTTSGVAAMTVLQLLWLRRLGMPIRPRLDFRDPLFGTLVGLGKPMVAVSVANFIGTALKANLLYTVRGAYSIYVYSFNLVMMPYGIFAVSIATVLFPAMSRAVAENDNAELSRTVSLGFRWTALVTAPMVVGLSVLALPIVRVLFERGDFSYADAFFTASFLRWYALSILPYALVMFVTRVFYARNDMVTPALINIGGVVLNTILNFALMWKIGVQGIAIAAVISYSVTTLVSVMMVRRWMGANEVRAILRAGVKIALATAGMAAILTGGLRLTAPEIATLEKGSRYPAPLQRHDPRSDYTVVSTPEDWESLWNNIGTASPPPEVDFSRRSVLALFGPQSKTTTTLTLLSADETTPGLTHFRARVNMPPDRAKLARTLPADSPTSPPYLLVSIQPADAQVSVDFEFKEVAGKPNRFRDLLQAPGLLRLIALVLLGGLAYCALAVALRTEELASLKKAVLDRLKRRGGKSEH